MRHSEDPRENDEFLQEQEEAGVGSSREFNSPSSKPGSDSSNSSGSGNTSKKKSIIERAKDWWNNLWGSGEPPKNPEPELPKDGLTTDAASYPYWDEDGRLHVGPNFTIDGAGFEMEELEFEIAKDGVNIKIIVTNVARVTFDIHDDSKKKGLTINIECGKGELVIVANDEEGFQLKAEADAIRVTAKGYLTKGDKQYSLNVHGEAAAFGGGIKINPREKDIGVSFLKKLKNIKDSVKVGYGWGWDFNVNDI